MTPSATIPDSVIKHDGRCVAFDVKRLESSLRRAALAADPNLPTAQAARLGNTIAMATGAAAMEAGKRAVATADVRALALKNLRDAGYVATADAYQDFAREAALTLWRVRVAAAQLQDTSAAAPWDRRRLLESLCDSGVAADVAGSAAREVERRIVALKQELVSPALIHALTLLILPPNTPGAKVYAARRVAFDASENCLHFNAEKTAHAPLPRAGRALEEFWLQCVHSPAVVSAARGRFIALDPYPYDFQRAAQVPDRPFDPLTEELTLQTSLAFDGEAVRKQKTLGVRVDSAERIAALAGRLGANTKWPGGCVELYFKIPAARFFDPAQRSSPITLNVGGVVAREARRDLKRATARIAELGATAVQAHREREEYFSCSPVRGRLLPVCAAGLWNAAAVLAGGSFDAPDFGLAESRIVEKLCEALSETVESLRAESGMNLALCSDIEPAAAQKLWHAECDYFARDRWGADAYGAKEVSLALAPESSYVRPFDVKLAPAGEFNNRMDFNKKLSALFDEAPRLEAGVAQQGGAEKSQWIEILNGFSEAGATRVTLTFDNSSRPAAALLQSLRAYLDGFPLLDLLNEER